MTNQSKREVRLIAWPELNIMEPYTRQHIQWLEKQGKFPKRIQIGDRRGAWDYWEIVAWIEARKSKRIRSNTLIVAKMPGNVIRLPVGWSIDRQHLNQGGTHCDPANRGGQ